MKKSAKAGPKHTTGAGRRSVYAIGATSGINARATLGKHVINEDRAILETVQRGMASANRPPLLGADEVRIKAFAAAYEAAMKV